MNQVIHRASQRGRANHGWLKSFFSFSFSNYYNPEKMGFGMLRVINDDIIAGGTGFGTHPHQNMEIVTIPLEGALEHKDSTGRQAVIRKGEVQIMSAGTGIAHSEYNYSKTDETKLLQIWVLPKDQNIKPRYEQKEFQVDARHNQFQTVVSPDEKDNGVWINQDAYFSLGNFESGTEGTYTVRHPASGIYLFVIEGAVEVEGELLAVRDAIGLTDISKVMIKAIEKSELLIIETPMN
jgi:quercetin 2,3-dioxygenase